MMFCKDCKHFSPWEVSDPDEDLRGQCGKDFVLRYTSIVGGEQREIPYNRPDAGTSRAMADGCGTEARWFEAANVSRSQSSAHGRECMTRFMGIDGRPGPCTCGLA